MNESNIEVMQVSAVQQIAKAEIDSQIATAKQYPRDIAKVKRDMISFATLDEETAESCFYNLPRGGKNIQGPSVRLAEIAVSCYGNLRAGVRIIDTVSSGDNPHVVIQAICHDLEKNVAVTIEKRRRITKKKSKESIDEDDINLAANAGSAIAFRDAVYKIVPGALIKPVYEQAKKVAVGDAKSIVDRRNRAVEAFSKMGVSKERVLAVVSKTAIDQIDAADLETLIGLHTAIKDGQTSVDDAFPATPATSPKFETPKKKTEPKPEPTPATPEPAVTSNVTDVSELGEPANPTPGSFESIVDSDAPEIEALKAALAKHEVTEQQVIAFCQKRNLMKDGISTDTIPSLSHIRSDKIAPLTKQILANGETLSKIRSGK